MNNSVRLVDHSIGVDVTGGATREAPAQAELRPTSAGAASWPWARYFCDLHGRTKAFKMAPHSKPRPAGAARLALH
jgi:hypothetical protein